MAKLRALRTAWRSPISIRLVHRLLPKLHHHLQGRFLTVPTFLALLRRFLPPLCSGHRQWRWLSNDEGLALLRRAANRGPRGGSSWRADGTRYVDNQGGSAVSKVAGYHCIRARGRSQKFFWQEHGGIYRIQEVENSGRFQVLCNSTAKVVGVLGNSKILRLTVRRSKRNNAANHRKAILKPSSPDPAVVWVFEKPYWTHGVRPRETLSCRTFFFDPLNETGMARQPKWSVIYLHMFSLEGSRYWNFPHYFNAGTEPVRVVCPTAPNRPQGCFSNLKSWNNRARRYTQMKFRSWFDYMTDNAGSGENEIDFASLFETRRLIHAIIKHEVERVGDPRRVILGGASQGCCTALDAAYTYPDTLGGVIGLIGHLLGVTPLDPSKRSMPVHLFHETSDEEMNWQNFVGHTVQRMKSEGFNVISTRERDPCGGGHDIGRIEGVWIRRALRQIVGQ